MKMLVVGDFHGRFPKKFEDLIKKEKIDLVVSNGDYPPFHYRKLWFKHCYDQDVNLWEVIGKKKYRELVMEDMRRAEEALKKLNKLKIPVFTVLGNIDYPMPDDVSDVEEEINESNMPNWDKKELFSNRLKKYKNIKRFDYSSIRFKDFIFIGMRGHSYAGDPKSKAFKKHKEKLDRLFERFKRENKEERVIFVSHNVPYDTKLDKVGKKAHKLVRGKHVGSKLTRKIIDQKKPILAFGGHVHESKGKQKIGKTWIVNPGAIHDGEAAIVEISDDKKREVKIKLIG